MFSFFLHMWNSLQSLNFIWSW